MKLYKIKPIQWTENRAMGMTHSYAYYPEHHKYRLIMLDHTNTNLRPTVLDFDTIEEIHDYVDAHNVAHCHHFLELYSYESTTESKETI